VVLLRLHVVGLLLRAVRHAELIEVVAAAIELGAATDFMHSHVVIAHFVLSRDVSV
jgi:hypothetical protein